MTSVSSYDYEYKDKVCIMIINDGRPINILTSKPELYCLQSYQMCSSGLYAKELSIRPFR